MKPCSLSARLNLLREIIFHWDGTYWAMREGDGNASIATEIYQIQELQAGYSGGCRRSSASPADRWFIICSNGSWLDQCWTCFVSLYVINKPAHLSSLPGPSRVPLVPGSSVPVSGSMPAAHSDACTSRENYTQKQQLMVWFFTSWVLQVPRVSWEFHP